MNTNLNLRHVALNAQKLYEKMMNQLDDNVLRHFNYVTCEITKHAILNAIDIKFIDNSINFTYTHTFHNNEIKHRQHINIALERELNYFKERCERIRSDNSVHLQSEHAKSALGLGCVGAYGLTGMKWGSSPREKEVVRVYADNTIIDEVVIDEPKSEYPATLNADVVDIDKLADMFTRTNILSPNEVRAIMQSDSEERCTYCNSVRVNSSIQCSNCGANY